MAQPSKCTPEVVDEILRRLARGESLRSICSDPHMPARETVHTWVIEDRQGFAARYRAARDLGLDELADETLEIADGSGDWQRDRLRVDTRKWYLSKVAPRRYGERVHHEVSGVDGDPIRVGLPPEELSALQGFLADVTALLAGRETEEGGVSDDDGCGDE